MKGKEYTWPNLDAIDLLIADGMNLFRIPFRIERLSPDTVGGEFAPKYLEDLIAVSPFSAHFQDGKLF
jgi:endoglucanase